MAEGYASINLWFDGMYPAHLAVNQSHLDASGMVKGFGQQHIDNSARQFACALVFFQYDSHMQSGMDVFAVFSCHSPGHFLNLRMFAVPLYFTTCNVKAQSRLFAGLILDGIICCGSAGMATEHIGLVTFSQ